MALQESIKRTETNQHFATAIFLDMLRSHLSDQSLTKMNMTCYELPRNDGPILSSGLSPLLQSLCPAPAEPVVLKHSVELLPNTRQSPLHGEKNVSHREHTNTHTQSYWFF